MPDAIFRWELGGEAGTDGRARLRPREIADSLAFALTDERPPEWLVKAATKGELDST